MTLGRFHIRTDVITAFGIILFWAIVLVSLKNPVALDDGLRHFTMAKLLREGAEVWQTGWRGFFFEGYLSTTNVDPWFLSNVIMIPFTFFTLSTGLHVYTLLTLAALVLVSFFMLRSLKLSATATSLFLLILIFGDAQFIGRFLIARPYSLMTMLSIGVMYCILKRKYALLTILIALSVLLSQLFVFPLFFCGCAALAFVIAKEFRSSVRIAGSALIGTVIGLIAHPNPLSYLSYLFTAFLRIPFLKSIGLSREMQSGAFDVSMIGVAVLIAVSILLIVILHDAKVTRSIRSQPNILFFGLSSLILAAVFVVWLRAIDLLWPVLVLGLATVYSLSSTAIHERLKVFVPRKNQTRKILCAVIFCLALIQCLSMPYVFVRDDASHSLQSYEVMKIIPSNARVLNLDWDYFSIYLSQRPDLQYASGIDRAFTYLTDAHVSDAIRSLEEQSKTSQVSRESLVIVHEIIEAYPADYLILSHHKFAPLIPFLKSDEMFRAIVETKEVVIFEVL